MRAILIDPFNQTVTQIEYDGNFESIYKLIDADCFDCARITKMDGIFVDDGGLLKDPTHFFLHSEYPSPLAGKGLIVGCDYNGDSADTATNAEETKAKVRFFTIDQVRKEFA